MSGWLVCPSVIPRQLLLGPAVPAPCAARSGWRRCLAPSRVLVLTLVPAYCGGLWGVKRSGAAVAWPGAGPRAQRSAETVGERAVQSAERAAPATPAPAACHPAGAQVPARPHLRRHSF